MIVTEILGNTHEVTGRSLIGERHVEKIVLPSADLVKRIQRVTTDHGTELGLRLPADSPDLRDGDILAVEEGNAIVVSVLPTDVLVITPTSIMQMGFVAHSLGNRHLQAQFFDADSDYHAEVMVVQYDPHRGGVSDPPCGPLFPRRTRHARPLPPRRAHPLNP